METEKKLYLPNIGYVMIKKFGEVHTTKT